MSRGVAWTTESESQKVELGVFHALFSKTPRIQLWNKGGLTLLLAHEVRGRRETGAKHISIALEHT